jgi:hypothetical protein
MFGLWRCFWQKHGTKVIGFGSSIIGTLTYIDRETLHIIDDTLGPIWGPRVTHALMIVAGLMVAKRGFSNDRLRRATDVKPGDTKS